MPRRLDARAPGFAADFSALLEGKRETAADVDEAVAAIIADVRARGDAALIELTRKFDRLSLMPAALRISVAEIDAAERACAADALEALDLAARRIESYHRRLLPSDLDYVDTEGVRLGARWRPLAAVGIYVPGGLAAYPSSVLMNALPARVAGVERVAMVVPAPDGKLNPLVLAAAKRAGVGEIYRIGGAQAVAALAYGTATVRPVDKIVGPGNAYVAAAKRRVYGVVGIDMIAGPSEILVVADAGNDAAWIAADLLSQCEHDAAAQAILITDDSKFAEAVARAVNVHLRTLPRAGIAGESWERHGALITVEDWGEAVELVDRIAPEHLEIALETGAAEAVAAQVRHAGAIFIGRHTPEAVGDYVGGPNHVLPTARSARFSSGLSAYDFLKRTSILSCGPEALRAIGPAAMTLAHAEGLDAHALSVALRLNLPAR
ncbi:MAG TPA: histidinol dehydrogenase [Stellaceae bacterium]|nr:histidinol dehydrogenase [Stellaceae bacterium]